MTAWYIIEPTMSNVDEKPSVPPNLPAETEKFASLTQFRTAENVSMGKILSGIGMPYTWDSLKGTLKNSSQVILPGNTSPNIC